MFKNGFKIFSALLLTILLTGSLLTKPVHILFGHHDSEIENCRSTSSPAIHTDHHHDCPICDFEFCSYISQKTVALPNAQIFVLGKLVSGRVLGLQGTTPSLFLLRAPPAL